MTKKTISILNQKKYKILFLYEGVWREYKSNQKINNSPSEFNSWNAKKVKNKLMLDPNVKSVKIVDSSYEVENLTWFKRQSLKIDLNPIREDKSLFISSTFSKIDFEKSNYIMKPSWQIVFLFKNSLNEVIYEYKYEIIKELNEDLKEELDKILQGIKSQTGRLFSIEILPILKRKGFS